MIKFKKMENPTKKRKLSSYFDELILDEKEVRNSLNASYKKDSIKVESPFISSMILGDYSNDSDEDNIYSDSGEDSLETDISDTDIENSEEDINESHINEHIKSNEKIYYGSLLTVKLFNLLYLFTTFTLGLSQEHCDMLYQFILLLLPIKNNCPKSYYRLLKNVLIQPSKLHQNCKKCDYKKNGKFLKFFVNKK
jgi:hypothetical protein